MEQKPPTPALRTPRRKGQRVGLAILLAALALGAAHTALWRITAQQMEAGFAGWVQLRRSQGWRVEHGPLARGGWPFAVTQTARAVMIEGGGATLPGGMTLTAERMVMRVALPRIDRLRVDFPAAQRLRIADQDWGFVADRLSILVPLAADTLPREAELEAEALRIGSPRAAPFGAPGVAPVGAALDTLDVSRLRVTLETSSTATEGEAALRFVLATEGIRLPQALSGRAAAGLGRNIAALQADLIVTGPVPSGRVPMQRAEAWRDNGGTLELRSLSLNWGPINASAAATLALDEALQPMGAGTLRIAGAALALEALAEAGIVGRRAANTARAMLPLLTRPSANGGPPDIAVPLTVEDRTLAVARIPVLRFEAWAWPAPP